MVLTNFYSQSKILPILAPLYKMDPNFYTTVKSYVQLLFVNWFFAQVTVSSKIFVPLNLSQKLCPPLLLLPPPPTSPPPPLHPPPPPFSPNQNFNIWFPTFLWFPPLIYNIQVSPAQNFQLMLTGFHKLTTKHIKCLVCCKL